MSGLSYDRVGPDQVRCLSLAFNVGRVRFSGALALLPNGRPYPAAYLFCASAPDRRRPHAVRKLA